MELDSTATTTRQLSRWMTIGILLAAIVLGLAVLYHTNHSPRTDDAEVFANFIGIAPQVEGPIVRLNVRDNQFVKKGELLYEIDERPYQYALERALSEQAALEGQIADEQRRINALVSGVSVAKANISSSQADVARRGGGRRTSAGGRGQCGTRGEPGKSRVDVREQQPAPSRAASGKAICHRRSGGPCKDL